MINTINGILEAAKGGKTGVIAVTAAHDQPVIEAVVEARKEGIATPILVGHVDEIKDMLAGLGENPADYEIVAGDSDTDCAAKAVALCAEGKANFLMKGILGTADLMRAVFNKECGLRTSHLTTHCMFYEIPAYGKMVILTDGGVALDLAVSKEACHHKHYTAPGAGDADILLVPNYEVGNGIGKAASLFGNAKNAGIILGAKVPIVLVSRADSAESKLASIAAGSVLAQRMELN